MDDPLAVRGCQSFSYGTADLEPLLDRDRAFSETLVQSRSTQQLGDRVGDPLVDPEIMNVENIWMRESSHRPRLSCESINSRLASRRLGVENFDGDVATEFGIAGTINDTHTTCAQMAFDLVATEQLPSYQIHCDHPVF